jgi:hypothetical protein
VWVGGVSGSRMVRALSRGATSMRRLPGISADRNGWLEHDRRLEQRVKSRDALQKWEAAPRRPKAGSGCNVVGCSHAGHRSCPGSGARSHHLASESNSCMSRTEAARPVGQADVVAAQAVGRDPSAARCLHSPWRPIPGAVTHPRWAIVKEAACRRRRASPPSRTFRRSPSTRETPPS